MQPKAQPNTQKNLLYSWQALKLILPYLKLSDLLGSATISKQWQYHLNQYIKKYLLPQPYSETAIDALQAAKLVFNRKIMIRELNSVKQIEFPDICSKIQVGTHATKFQTLQGNTYIVKMDKLLTLNKKDWSNPAVVYKLPTKFTSARLISSYIYLLNGGQIVRYTTTNESIFNQQISYQFQHSIDHLILSNSAGLVVMSNNPKGTEYMFFTHKQFHPVKINLPVTIEHPYTDIVLDFGTHGFVISNKGTLYQADFRQQQVKLTEHKGLKSKIIGKLKCGKGHYFAYERKRKLLGKWANAQVLKWAEQQGFDIYLNILQAQKVTGQKLLNMNKTYMQDVLGITNILTQQKMNVLIQEYNKDTDNFQDYNIYYWGKNHKGQLCTNPSANVNNPAKLKLPQNIQVYTLFGDYTLLLNTKTQQITVNILDEQGKLKWQHLTSNKIWTLAGHKNFIIDCESKGKKFISQAMSQELIHIKKQKLRTAKNIIDQVQWDTNLKKEQFTVGYLNRHQGTLQCSFEQFLKSDVKQNSILYFKKSGKLVWDKKTRLDIL